MSHVESQSAMFDTFALRIIRSLSVVVVVSPSSCQFVTLWLKTSQLRKS